ncbi:MAG: hypothetical protein ABSB89_03060 [Candidatus Bathyarchaeia archaeon]|jgi:hypothetical protein
MQKEIKRKTRTYGVAAVLLALILGVLCYNLGFTGTKLKPTAPNDITYVGPISFQFSGGNASELTVASGSAGKGTIQVNVTEADPLLIYDYAGGGFNQSATALPAGLSVSLNMYGNLYDVPQINQVALDNATALPLSTVPLIPTTLGETTFQYTINTASTVPAGTYTIHISFLPILQGDEVPASTRAAGINEMQGLGEVYAVTINVQ